MDLDRSSGLFCHLGCCGPLVAVFTFLTVWKRKQTEGTEQTENMHNVRESLTLIKVRLVNKPSMGLRIKVLTFCVTLVASSCDESLQLHNYRKSVTECKWGKK